VTVRTRYFIDTPDDACAFGREDIDGVPLGISRDYDYLPRVTDLRLVHCMTCWQRYADAARRQLDGVECRALRCKLCREEAREAWIVKNRADLPHAVARYRG
jgi:hypothetical protein